MAPAVLMILTAADRLPLAGGREHETGYWASEVTEPHEVLTGAGFDVVVATPGGKVPPVDPASLDDTGAAAALDRIEGLAAPRALSSVEDVTDFAAVLLPGGHGPMADLCSDPQLGRILRAAVAERVPVAAVCHGPAGLLSARQDPQATWPFAGRRMTAFSDAEEGDLAAALRWSLERELRDAGAQLVLADKPFAEQVVVDGLLVTGQNPASAGPAAAALVEVLAERGLR